ncbi:MAG: VWA domain-containing protein [Polyangiales bacterium]
MRLAPIEPGDDVQVSLTLLHNALPTSEGHRVVVPLTYMPRYVEDPAALSATESAALARPRAASGARADVTITLRGVGPSQVRCVSHATQVAEQGSDAVLRVEDAPLDRDLIVEVLDRVEGDARITLRRSEAAGPDGLGPCTLATVTPGRFADEGPTTPRTVLFLVDRSGSMEGRPMEAAKRAVRGSLRALGAQDRFNLIAFDDRLEALASTPVPFTDESLAQADRFATALTARGGTEASAALTSVLGDALKGAKIAWKERFEPDRSARLRIVLFMTDGDVANAAGVLRAAREALVNTRVHVLGIGDSVDHALLGELAELGGGTYTPVSSDEDLERAIQRLKSAFDAPLWTSVEARVLRGGERLPPLELEPARRWDLYAGAPFTFGWRGEAQKGDALELQGRGPDGVVRTHTISLDAVPAMNEAHARWASLRARRLTYRFDPADDEALEALGAGYGLITRRTSLLGVDPAGGGRAVEARVPVSYPMPREFDDSGPDALTAAAIGGAMAYAAAPMASLGVPPGAPPPSPKKSKGGPLRRAARSIAQLLAPPEPEAELAAPFEDREEFAKIADATPAPAPAAPRADSPADDASALRALLLAQGADGLFGDLGGTLAAVAALVSRGHTPREGDFRAELKRTAATLRARLPGLAGDEATWAAVALALLTAPHGGAVVGLAEDLERLARAVRLGDPNALRRSVIALVEAAPLGWDRSAQAGAARRRFLR